MVPWFAKEHVVKRCETFHTRSSPAVCTTPPPPRAGLRLRAAASARVAKRSVHRLVLQNPPRRAPEHIKTHQDKLLAAILVVPENQFSNFKVGKVGHKQKADPV